MATKKAAPKKAVKASGPVSKAASKKPAAVQNRKPAPKKAAAKSAPAKKAAAHASPKKAVAAVKAAPKKAAPPPKKAVPAPAKKTGINTLAAKADKPQQKPTVAAPSKPEVKPAIRPIEKPATKKEPAKPFVIPKTSTSKSVKYQPDFTKSVLDTHATSAHQSGPTMRYSDAELSEFRELIQRKLDTAKKELAYLQGLITRKDESGDLDEGRYMTMEDGSMSMEREQLSQMASRQIQFIDHLEKAIMRIENKTYGICRVTGKLIDKARLRAVPHATLSIEAKQMMNK